MSAPVPAVAAIQAARDHVAKGALSMIDRANHKPENRGQKPKVGGHQASSMSSVDLLCALYLHTLRPQDRLAVKPHAAPVVYSLMHLMGVLPPEAMGRLRELGGPQPYPTRLKNPDFVHYTTSSEALGVCATIYDALAAKVHGAYAGEAAGRGPNDQVFWAHCGDGELTEGQIDESLYDAGRWALDNLVWIVDLNRQSLDRVMDDSGRLERWVEGKFRTHGWAVHPLRWGSRAEGLFGREGGEALRAVLDRMPDALFHPLLLLEGAGIRRALLGGSGEGSRAALLERYAAFEVSDTERRGIETALQGVGDDDLREAVTHLGGHDLGALIEAYRGALAEEGPVVIVAHTVKGWQTSAAGHPENHGALLPEGEVRAWGAERGLPEGAWYPRPDEATAAAELLAARARLLFEEPDLSWQAPPAEIELGDLHLGRRERSSTGEAFQALNLAVLRTEIAPFVQFGAPDVGQTTHLGPVIRQSGVFAPRDLPDTYDFLREERESAFHWRPERTGQFHSLGIAEGNAMLWAYAFGRQVQGVEERAPLLPVVTVYDKFFERGFNQLDYATYSGARFVAVGVPSGTGLSREAATHQSLQTPRMVMDLPGIVAYEPAFAEDVRAIYAWALSQLWDDDGEAVYLRLSTQPLEQPDALPADHAAQAVRGAYWLVGDDERAPAAGQPMVIFVASGRKVADAQQAGRQLHADGIGSRILNVTSYEALWRGWDRWNRERTGSYWLHDLFADAEVNAPLILVGDHVPSVAEWLPGALHRVRAYRFLGPRGNGEAGDLASIDALHGMGVADLVAAAREEVAWRREVGLPA